LGFFATTSLYTCHTLRETPSFPFGPTLDPVPPGAVKLNDEDPLALHFPVRADDEKPRLIELVFDVEQPDYETLFPEARAEALAIQASQPPKIKHEHNRRDLGNGVYTPFESSKLHLPSNQCADFRELVSTQDCLYVDKTLVTITIEDPGFVGVVGRPPGCGKTTWLSTLAYLHDIHHAKDHQQVAPFADDVPFPGANRHHIFRLDFAELVLFVRTKADYTREDSSSPAYSRTYMYAARALKNFICEKFRKFFDKYQEEIHISDSKKEFCFSPPRKYFSPHPLYMLIDNYTAPFLHEHLDEDTKSQIDACLYKEFFCIVGPLINLGRLDRVTSLPMDLGGLGKIVRMRLRCRGRLGLRLRR
ncbi:uncharacterized protein EV420DRAFT_1574707, partial [Desarmillaria tabescens]